MLVVTVMQGDYPNAWPGCQHPSRCVIQFCSTRELLLCGASQGEACKGCCSIHL